MRGWDFENSRSVTLDGEWQFYPEQFLTHAKSQSSVSQRYVQVPGDWRSALSTEKNSSYGYGTYRLRILIDKPLEQPYGFWIQNIQATSIIIINGEKLGGFGVLAEQSEGYKPKVISYTASYIAGDQSVIELLIQASNFDNPKSGGIVQSIKFGSQATIDTERWYSIGFQLFTFVIMLLHTLYAVILYLFNQRRKELVIFALMLLFVSIAIAIDNDSLLLIWLPINYTWALKIKLLSYMLATFLMLILTQGFSRNGKGGRLFQLLSVALGLYSAFILLSPVQNIYYSLPIFVLMYVLPLIQVIYLIVKVFIQKHRNALFLLLAVTSIACSVAWGILQNIGLVTVTFYPFDMIAAIVTFSSYWFKQYFNNAEENTKLTEQLKRTDKLKDEFLANTSHELRTPLHGIINIAQKVMINEKAFLNEKSFKDMNLLITVSRRMSHLLNDLLDITRLQDKKITLHKEQLHLQSAASGVIDMLDFMTAGKPLELRMDIPKSFPPVFADEKRLVQILINLLHNAIKYTHEGMISITAESKGKEAVIHVTDTGSGIEREIQARVLQRYEQGASGINNAGGIGLGLSICKELVELHGGQLTLQSEPGAGSVFTFTLPLYAQARDFHEAISVHPQNDEISNEVSANNVATMVINWADIQDTKLTPPPTEETMNILAVDDDPVNLEVLRSILSAEPYHIVSALSGKEALNLLNTGQWDLVISDVMMPHMSGYELTRMIRERFTISELPILLLTARSQPEDIYSGFLSGANDYVTKPVDALELKYRVWSLTTLKQSFNERLSMEAAYLQAQIQPHFLFNTLNSLMALSYIDTERMRELGDAFSSYLRISFNFINLERLVPLSNELELIEAYLFIEKERFKDRLDIVWEIEPDIDLRLPPLTIQPLVENAVRHGLLSQSKGGTLQIRIHRQNGGTFFEVKDNGKGMNEEKVNMLLDHSSKENRGIGLINTNRRLEQLYGKGLVIQSKPGEGTTVSFVIPNQENEVVS
ncbi:hybrid sensor histidine kinase/response regulator [Paenibacillus sp. IHBB 10380]|uniref:hybrid sensor histidine kinase/response regulator n=1 Tax=Paenibacillus sp. IHBB 10380 TaxID=1566358 RepID=UPI002D219172|nr:ATP-binding protein [Paenibacillus sp. IHBB 10380]